MKKLLTLAALVGTASLSFGQGSVNFANSASSTTHIATNSVVGGASTGRITAATAGGSYYFALFVAPSTTTGIGSGITDPTTAGFTYVATGTNNALGRFNGNPTTDGTIVNGFAITSTASFIICGWSGNIGTTWTQVQSWLQGPNQLQNAFYGLSGVATGVILGGGPTPQGTIFGGGAGQILGFNLGLAPVPEPSSFALAGLGAAALLIFRRRK
jgi:hypothetical protein